jgi:hypothetical protein
MEIGSSHVSARARPLSQSRGVRKLDDKSLSDYAVVDILPGDAFFASVVATLLASRGGH